MRSGVFSKKASISTRRKNEVSQRRTEERRLIERIVPGFVGWDWHQGCSTLWNRQDFEKVIEAPQSSAIAVLAGCAGLV